MIKQEKNGNTRWRKAGGGKYASDANKKPHGNTLNDEPTDIYIRIDKDGNHLKPGIAKDASKRYPKKELLDGKEAVEIGNRPRDRAAKIERFLSERKDYPDDNVLWSGKRDPSSPNYDPNYIPKHMR